MHIISNLRPSKATTLSISNLRKKLVQNDLYSIEADIRAVIAQNNAIELSLGEKKTLAEMELGHIIELCENSLSILHTRVLEVTKVPGNIFGRPAPHEKQNSATHGTKTSDSKKTPDTVAKPDANQLQQMEELLTAAEFHFTKLTYAESKASTLISLGGLRLDRQGYFNHETEDGESYRMVNYQIQINDVTRAAGESTSIAAIMLRKPITPAEEAMSYPLQMVIDCAKVSRAEKMNVSIINRMDSIIDIEELNFSPYGIAAGMAEEIGPLSCAVVKPVAMKVPFAPIPLSALANAHNIAAGRQKAVLAPPAIVSKKVNHVYLQLKSFFHHASERMKSLGVAKQLFFGDEVVEDMESISDVSEVQSESSDLFSPMTVDLSMSSDSEGAVTPPTPFGAIDVPEETSENCAFRLCFDEVPAGNELMGEVAL